MWRDVLRGLLANTLFVAGTVILALLIPYLAHLRLKRLFRRFWGIRGPNQITLCLPGVEVRNFNDRAVPSGEIYSWLAIDKGIQDRWLSKALDWLVSRFSQGHSEFRMPNLRPCRIDTDWSDAKVENWLKEAKGSVICLGGPLTNAVTRFLMKTKNGLQIPVKKDGQKYVLEGAKGRLIRNHSSILYEPESLNDDFAVLERFSEADLTVFVIAGRGRNGVFQAASHLIKKWPTLLGKYSMGGFALAWAVQADASDNLVYTVPRRFLWQGHLNHTD